MKHQPLLYIIPSIFALFLSGCATNTASGKLNFAQRTEKKVSDFFNSSDPCSNNSMHLGAILGGIAGGIIGYNNNGAKGAIAGTIAGAGVGGLIGHEFDSRRCNLYKVAKADNLHLMSRKITLNKEVAGSKGTNKATAIGLDVQLRNNDNEFVPGTAQLTSQSRIYLADIAKLYTPETMEASLPSNATPEQKAQARNRKILIVGHTDERDNVPGVNLARLSQMRARAVAEVFSNNGVPRENINYQGAGDMMPLASNATAQGRQDNNRVQIIDVPSDKDLSRYVAHRTVNPTYFKSMSDIRTKPNQISKASSQPSSESKKGAGEMVRVPTKVQGKNNTTQQRVSVATSTDRYGFDGVPLTGDYQVDLGADPSSGSSYFSFISSAHAATSVIVKSCLQDHVRESTNIRNLATGEPLKIRDAMPGLYGQPWMGAQGHSEIALLHVYAPRDAAAPVPPVTVEFYRKKNGKIGRHPLYIEKKASVNIYRGNNATLYRVFTHGPAQCLDLYVPYRSNTGSGLVIYPKGNREYKAKGEYKSLG